MRSVRHQFAMMEILALSSGCVFLLAGFLILEKSIVHNYIRSQMRDIARVEGIIETIISDSTQELETFMLSGGTPGGVAFLDEFADVYHVDRLKRVSVVLKKSGKSRITGGFDVGTGALGAFLDRVTSPKPVYSPIFRAVECDEPGMYSALAGGGEWLVGRIDLHRLADKLEKITMMTGSFFIIASEDGSVLFSSMGAPPFRVLPGMKRGEVSISGAGYSYLRRHIGILENDIVVLSPMTPVRKFIWRLRIVAMVFSVLLFMLIMARVLIQTRMIISPLQEFSRQIAGWKHADRGLEAPELFLKNTEMRDLYMGFTASVEAIGEKVTMLRSNREELRRSHERFSILLKNLSDIILVLDGAGRISFISESIERVGGYTPGELMGVSAIEELVHPEDRERILDSFRVVFGTPEDAHRVEFRARNRNGSWMWMEAMGSNLLNVEPINGIVLNIRDISVRRQMEEQKEVALAALRESEERYRLHFENTSDVIYSLDREGTVLSVSPPVERLLGYRPDELVGRRFQDLGLIAGETLKTGARDLMRVLSGQFIQASVYEFIARDGTHRFGEASITPLRNRDGVYAMIGVARDITERMRMEEDLSQAMTQYRSTLDSMGDYIHVVDADMKVILMNRPFIEWIGGMGLETDAVGISLFELFPFLTGMVRAQYATVFRDGMMMLTEETTEIGGREIVTETRKIPIVRAGRVEQVVTVIRDITGRKRAESQIERSLHENETLLRELFHRTKNNMQVITSMLSLQSSYSADPEIKKVLKEMSNRISSIALVHQKLYRARNLSRIDLSDYIYELVHLILKSYGPGFGEVTPVLALESVSVLIDVAIPCGLVLNELITNAMKYAFREGCSGTLTVSLKKTPGDELELCFADNGAGLPAGFDFRGARTLGMMIIHGIVEHQLQGCISFSGEGGVSCRIRFNPNLYHERV